MNSMQRDLRNKFRDDLERIVRHYVSMSEVASIHATETLSSVMTELLYFVIYATQTTGMPKDAFMRIMSEAWDRGRGAREQS